MGYKCTINGINFRMYDYDRNKYYYELTDAAKHEDFFKKFNKSFLLVVPIADNVYVLGKSTKLTETPEFSDLPVLNVTWMKHVNTASVLSVIHRLFADKQAMSFAKKFAMHLPDLVEVVYCEDGNLTFTEANVPISVFSTMRLDGTVLERNGGADTFATVPYFRKAMMNHFYGGVLYCDRKDEKATGVDAAVEAFKNMSFVGRLGAMTPEPYITFMQVCFHTTSEASIIRGHVLCHDEATADGTTLSLLCDSYTVIRIDHSTMFKFDTAYDYLAGNCISVLVGGDAMCAAMSISSVNVSNFVRVGLYNDLTDDEYDRVLSMCVCINNLKARMCKYVSDLIEYVYRQRDKEGDSTECMMFLDKYPTLKTFTDAVKKSVIGQDEAVESACYYIYMYLVGLMHNEVTKQNFIMTGPSGIGKTEFIRTVSRILESVVSFTKVMMFSATSLTSTGFKGFSVDDFFTKVYDVTHGNGKAIIFLDEFDKRLMPIYESNGRNVSDEIMCDLLTAIEGNKIVTSKGKTLNTRNTLFVGLGTFDEVRKNRFKSRAIGGFTGESYSGTDLYSDPIKDEELYAMGIKAEFIGRFTEIVNFHRLERNDLKLILDKYINNIRNKCARTYPQFDATFDPAALDAFLELGESEQGARAMLHAYQMIYKRINIEVMDLMQQCVIDDVVIKSLTDYEIHTSPKPDDRDKREFNELLNDAFDVDDLFNDIE